MKKMMKRLRNERGLTLVELLAVVVILAIIAVIAFVFIGGIIENSKKDAHIANAQQIISAAKLHEATGGDFDEIAVGGEGGLIARDYLDVVLDPWTKKEYADLENIKVVKAEAQGEDEEGKVLTINNFSVENCNIDGETEASLSKKDRTDLCD